ncbi:YidB family protein [Pseudomarimonas arenosa]|uniref:DUF937 domain-containing protein n=1 Tax=Pseudomarimonas arenosa TaxID=2774145 RepID=A0AAW3ZPN8_9GAMM|nr:YidB family protein [Pseudomarimonas arenosa]MBD8527139.1 DUF937 domain-containing protein [Pseudomarimonas arenosa]
MGVFDELLGGAGGKHSPLESLLGNLGEHHGSNPLGDLVGRALGGDQAKSAALIAAALSLVKQMGGFEKVLEMFQQKGLGGLTKTWLSKGSNAPLAADEVTRVFGKDAIHVVAQKAGVSNDQASSALGEMLPELLNQLSPNGSLLDTHEQLLSKGLDLLSGR